MNYLHCWDTLQTDRERERVKSNYLPMQNVILVRSREFSVLLYHLRPEKKQMS